MSTMFPSMISNEPPPLDSGDEEEDNDDYIEFRTGGLKLDILGDPSPLSSPQKLPVRSKVKDPDPPSQICANSNVLPDSPARVNGDCNPKHGSHSLNMSVTDEKDRTEDEDLTVINSIELCNGELNVTQVQPSSESTSCPLDSLMIHADAADTTSITPKVEHIQSSGESIIFQTTSVAGSAGNVLIKEEEVIVDEQELTNREYERRLTVPMEIESNFLDAEADHLASANNLEPSPNLDSCTTTAQEHIPSSTSETDWGEDDFEEFHSAGFKDAETEGSPLEEYPAENIDHIPSSYSDATACSKPEIKNLEDHSPIPRPMDTGMDPNPTIGYDGLGSISTVLPATCDSGNLVDDEWRPFEDAAPNAVPETNDFDEDDFGDFTSSELTEAPPIGTIEVPTTNILVEDRFDAIIKSLFSHASESVASDMLPFKSIDTELKNGSSNKTWTHVQEFEDSYGLVFKWANSGVYQHLLKSLNVDPSTILYSGKWGTIEVPKFAASLVDTPLQPQASLKPSQVENEDFYQNPPEFNSPASSSQSPGGESSNSGIGEPEDKIELKMSKESIKILEQLPDLSYMRAKTLVFPRNPKY